MPGFKNFWYLDMELRTFCCVCKLTSQNSNDWLKKKKQSKQKLKKKTIKTKIKKKNVLLSKPAFLFVSPQIIYDFEKEHVIRY